MTTFFQRLTALCEKKNTNVTNVLKELNESTSKGTAWKNGSIPNGAILDKLASYFGVSVDYLLGRTHSPNVILIPADPAKVAEEQAEQDRQTKERWDNLQGEIDNLIAAHSPDGYDQLSEDDKAEIAEIIRIKLERQKNKKK